MKKENKNSDQKMINDKSSPNAISGEDTSTDDTGSVDTETVKESSEEDTSTVTESVKESSDQDSSPDTESAKEEVSERMKKAEIFLERGNYAEAGELLDELSNVSDLTQEDQERVEELQERMKPDPVAVWIGVGCLLVIAVLAITTLGR